MIRLGGLVSGLDTESIIGSLLQAEQTKRIRLDNRIFEQENKLAAWNELDTAVTDLYNAAQDLTAFSTWSQRSATSSNTDDLTATADNNAVKGTYSIVASQLAQSHRIGSDAQSSSSSALGLSGDFTVGGETVTVGSTDSLADIRDSINSAANNMDDDEKVSASIINTTLVIERVKTGNTEIDLDLTDSDNVLENLGILTSGKVIKNELQEEKDLAATVNGIAVTSAENSNVAAITGVSLNFHDTATTTLTVSPDDATIKSLLGTFIEKYNTAMEMAESKSAVSLSAESNEVDGVGILQGENLVASLTSKSRLSVTAVESDPNVLDQAFNSLQSIGIWTTGRNNRMSIVDEDRLDAALANNFDEVEDLLRDFDGGVMKNFERVLDSMISPIDGAIVNRSRNLQAEVDKGFDELDAFDEHMEDLEDTLWERFARMENAMAQINQQSSFLLSSLGASPKK